MMLSVMRVQAYGSMAVFTLAFCLTSDIFAQSPLQPAPAPQASTFQRIINGPNASDAGIVNDAIGVLQELANGTATQIPENLLASAEGVAIIPRYVRGAFVIGVAGGRGVLLVRDANRNWQAPEFMTIGGGSVGWQAGVQSTDLVLVFRSPRSLANIRTGKLTLGANASAAAGPVGRFASAATDAHAQAEIFTYSRTRGLFAGIALDGASLQIDAPATRAFYQTTAGGPGSIPPAAITLVELLTRLSRTVVPTTAIVESIPNASLTTPAPLQNTVLPSKPMIAIPPGGLRQLETEVISLVTNVNEEWKLFLALPGDWQNASEIPVEEVASTLARYESVATNPKFAALNTTPAFQQAIASLRILAAQTPQPSTLVLPPPPAIQVR